MAKKTKQDDMFLTVRREQLASSKVDFENKVIEGYVVIQKGDLLDYRDYTIDDETMEQLVKLGNTGKLGVKVRWTHPDFMSDHLGKYMGRATNYRVDGDVVRGDIAFSEAAEISPIFDRDPVAYILKLADEDPTAFATSIYFERDGQAMAKLADALDGDGPVPIRVKELLASDIVDEGAAARSFFSKQNSSALPSGEGDEDPEQKEIDMADEAKKIEEAKALARDEANKANADRLARLQAAFEDADFVLKQYAKGNDVVEAKAEWADVLQDQLAKKDQEIEELKKVEAKDTKKPVDGVEPLENKGEGTYDETVDSKIDALMETGISRAAALQKLLKDEAAALVL